MTGVLALAESHISIHTWPEHNLATVDIFMCGRSDPLKACNFIIDSFKTKNFKLKLHNRGLL